VGPLKEKAAVYARVSQQIQKKHGDLERQIQTAKRAAEKDNKTVVAVYTDVASGLNDKRKGLKKMFSGAAKGMFSEVYVTFPDRLSRFCVAYLERHLETFRVGVNYPSKNEGHDSSPQEELVRDMMAIIASFSGRLHGLRARKNREKERQRMRWFRGVYRGRLKGGLEGWGARKWIYIWMKINCRL